MSIKPAHSTIFKELFKFFVNGSDTKTRETKHENIEQDICSVVVLGDHAGRCRCSGRTSSVEYIPVKYIIVITDFGGDCNIWFDVRRRKERFVVGYREQSQSQVQRFARS